MRKGTSHIAIAAWFGLITAGLVGHGQAETITLESLTGPSTFAAAGNAQSIIVPTSIGNVTISGGVVLRAVTNLPANQTTIYGTAGNATGIGITTGTGFTNPLTITFPVPITNFFLDVLNGNVQNVTYQVADNTGNNASFTLVPNLSSGTRTIGFAATGSIVTVGAITGQSTPNGITWDYFIDNISFNQPLPPALAPEPSSFVMAGTASMAGLGCFWLRRRRAAS